MPPCAGHWASDSVREMVWALQKVHDVQHNQPVFLDIGANVGAFTIAIAALGYDVIAFEGLARKQLALYTSLCASPDLAARVTLCPEALGARETDCTFFSDKINAGALHAACTVSLTQLRACMCLLAACTVSLTQLRACMCRFYCGHIKLQAVMRRYTRCRGKEGKRFPACALM